MTTFPSVSVEDWTIPESLNLLQGLKDVETSSTKPKCTCGCRRFREHFVRQAFKIPTVAIALAKKFWPDIQYTASSIIHQQVRFSDEQGGVYAENPCRPPTVAPTDGHVAQRQMEKVEAVKIGGGY